MRHCSVHCIEAHSISDQNHTQFTFWTNFQKITIPPVEYTSHYVKWYFVKCKIASWKTCVMKSMHWIMTLTIQSISFLSMIKLRERHQYWLQLHFTSSFVLMIRNKENLENQLMNVWCTKTITKNHESWQLNTWYSINFSACSLSSSLDSLKNLFTMQNKK